MNKKLVMAVAAFGIGLSMNASAYWGSECSVAQMNSERYCNIEMDQDKCRYWINVVKSCGMDVMV